MPMPRLFGVGLSALMILGALIGPLAIARPAAASVTTHTTTELRSGPGYEYPVTATVAAGSSLTIDGPPQAEFYPVTVNGQSGWVHGATLEILKDAAAVTEVAAAPPATGEAAPVAAYEGQAAAQEVPADGQAPPAADQAPPDTQAPPADPSAPPADPAAAATDPAAATNQAPAEGQPSPAAEAPPVEGATAGDQAPAAPADPATTDPATTDPAAQANPPADPAATVVPADQPETAVPEVSPSPSPVATQTPEPAPTGQASIPGGANLFQEPNASSYVVFWVPAGSTVWRLGETRNGFVHVDYMAMAGWVEAGTLTEPAPVTAESIPESAPAAENVRTPRPGSGVAFTTVELALRAGPSAAEAQLATVPPGTRVVMTGVMENGFHRVDYKGTLGWLASDYLSTPADPTATPEPTADSGIGSSSSRYQRTYTRDQIVSIIYAAADRYGQSRSDMLRVAECESALDPYAVHPSGSYGLFQFIRSTWKQTPYGDQDVFDPKANSNAAAWMWAQGRQSEWVCK